jgi:membrane-bound lytic murein transglycosylase B
MKRHTTILLAAALLAACATPVPTPASEPVGKAPAVDRHDPEPTVPPVPQPPERPVAPAPVVDPAIPQPQRESAFVDYTAATYGVAPDTVRSTLAQARFQQSIVDAMNRPAEKVKTWAEYRPIFLTDKRIGGGIAFMAEHRDELARVSSATGVPPEYIVAIIGVETSYGAITGKYRALDALYTLAFSYPKRAPFFAGELAQLFALGKEEGIDVATLQGSYAGAMGWGQFMPSSWRNWGRDGDGDGRRDLLGDPEDVFASIANYFVAHGWERGGPVVARADLAPGAAEFEPGAPDPVYPVEALLARGYTLRDGEPTALPGQGATVFAYDGAEGREQWIGYRNFYVITRYNHSPMYAMAVHQLAQAIRAGSDAAP